MRFFSEHGTLKLLGPRASWWSPRSGHLIHPDPSDMRNVLLLLFAIPLLQSCQGVLSPLICTEIGCASGLAIELASAPTGPVRIEAFVREGGPVYVYECADASRCGPGAFFADFTPEVVTIRVTTASGTVTRVVQPEYTKSRPNGPNCPPECLQGRVQLPLPAAAPPSPRE